ncbi:hypothetical protein K493DRAFT_256088 [Basidiobolus meristosporus CBS 931.73]|uniref:Glucosidase 2 subunit beta n=1 Tax=Basidiobolus meristosporus CBS 931.73 TaxID=1314790 RepID=A0A1Y1YS33_9FUNG|nr:hypothetical protein K493DRAFT_256088 [Basidiobolus meristosporus CBS 931.73]|eukprot:ORY00840.1 hypothetical protein K493DRAFT_256088 [Basidiobolus meristosporus CBS 931.73]
MKRVAQLALLSTLLTLSHATVTLNKVDPLLGVPESKKALYTSVEGTFRCLDGSKTIPYHSVNDDYCDCPDGSDEPGTSACPNSTFHCKNLGHMPLEISSSRVNDGVCDPECCDGSDEYNGFIECPNICEEVGRKYHEEMSERNRVQLEGGKVKAGYIATGTRLKRTRKAELAHLKNRLVELTSKVEELKAVKDKMEEEEKYAKINWKQKYAQKKRKSAEKITSLRDRIQLLEGQIDTLTGILKDLKENHNQNYHDLAVKSAISGYDEFTSAQDSAAYFEDYDYDEDDLDVVEQEEEDEVAEESNDHWFGRLLAPVQDQLNHVARFVGLGSKVNLGAYRGKFSDAKEAREAYEKEDREKSEVEGKIQDLERKLGLDFGLEEEFAELADQCFDYNTGEYTYEVCMFGSATQKSNKDFNSVHLGKFSRWSDNESSHPDHYKEQVYDQGVRCWNGPERSLKLYLTCGAQNEVTSVTEPEKCEYHMHMRSPAVCDTIKEADAKSSHPEEPTNESESTGASLETSSSAIEHDEL